MQRLAQRDGVIRSPVVLSFDQDVAVQSFAAEGPSQTWGAMPSTITPSGANIEDIAVSSPSLNAAMYFCTAASGSAVLTASLHLVKHGGKRRLEPQRFLDLVSGHKRVLAIL